MVTKLSRKQQELVEKNWLLIYGGMRKYWKQHYKLDKDEMEAHFGLMLCHAARTYKASRSKFSTWAYWWFFRGYMDLVKDRDRRGIRGRPGLTPTYVTPDFTDDSMEIVQGMSPKARAKAETQERIDDLRDLRMEYQSRRRRLSQREAEVIEARMRGETLKEIGERYGISRERVRQVEVGAVRVLRR